jgi:hypothetical protein
MISCHFSFTTCEHVRSHIPLIPLTFFDTQRNIAPGEKDVDSIVVPNKYCGFYVY